MRKPSDDNKENRWFRFRTLFRRYEFLPLGILIAGLGVGTVYLYRTISKHDFSQHWQRREGKRSFFGWWAKEKSDDKEIGATLEKQEKQLPEATSDAKEVDVEPLPPKPILQTSEKAEETKVPAGEDNECKQERSHFVEFICQESPDVLHVHHDHSHENMESSHELTDQEVTHLHGTHFRDSLLTGERETEHTHSNDHAHSHSPGHSHPHRDEGEKPVLKSPSSMPIQ